jgi:signal transduction histidine kinase/ActR/RegA family two-component response regulator
MDPIRAECIRALYAQMRAAGSAALIGVAYMIAAAAFTTPWLTILAWTAVMLTIQAARQILIRGFDRANPDGMSLERWAKIFVVHQAVAGLAWGSCVFLFGHPDEPVTISLVLSGMLLVVAGAVPAQAYTPASFHSLNAAITSLTFVRLVSTGEFAYILLGAITIVFGLAMRSFCSVQANLVRNGFRIRFENEALLREVTMQKAEAEEARRKAEAASLAKSQFLAAASHDLRQPLYALSLFSASLEALKLDDDGREVVSNIQNSISAMETLFTGLLDISRLDAGVVQPRLGPISIDDLFDRLSQYFLPIAIERGVELRFRSDGEWVRSDPVLLEQVLSNLVSNALHCTSKGAVLVAARKRNDQIRLEVWDTGIGIHKRDQQRIFDEFVQVENPERDRRKGLGLGLSIASRSASLINAGISVASQPGRGSRFVLLQPSSHPVFERLPAKSLVAEEPEAVHIMRRLPVLIVEDDRDVRLALSDILRRWNVDFEVAPNAKTAMMFLEGGKTFSAVLVDYRLPGEMNGLQLVRSIRQSHPLPLPVCTLITGDFDPALIGACNNEPVELLLKPLHIEKLRELLNIGENNKKRLRSA